MNRAWWVGAAAATLLAVPVGAYGVADAALPAPATTLSGGLPRRLDEPWLWTPTVDQAPPGRTTLVVGGSTFGLRNLVTGEGTVDLVTGDRHTLLPLEFDGVSVPGERLLLSPDGSRVAHIPVEGDEIAVRDLSDGSVRLAPADIAMYSSFVPLAWAPDSNRLLAAQDRDGGGDAVGEVDVATGRFTELASMPDVGERNPVPGFSAAYRADGQRSVVQIGGRLHLFDGGQTGPVLTLPAGTRLAGKGAWTPDSRGIVLVRDGQRSSELVLIDVATGALLPDRGFASLTGVLTQRLLGWLPNGHPVVVAYYPEPYAPAVLAPDDEHGHVTAFDVVRRLELVELDTTGGVRSLLAPQEQVLAIDVADQALAGAAVPGGPAPAWPVNPVVAAVVAVPVAVLLLLVTGLAVLPVRAARRRAKRGQPRFAAADVG